MKKTLSILFVIISFSCWGQEEKQQVFSLWQEAEEFMQKEQWTTAKEKSQEAYNIAKAEDWGDELLSSLKLLSRIAERQGKPELILQYNLDILDYNLKNGDKPSIYESYENLAQLYRNQDIHPKAIEYYHYALDYVPDKDLYGAREHFWEQLAYTHRLNENYDSSRFYHQYLIQKSIKKNDFNTRLFHLQKISDSWLAEKNYEKALEVNDKIRTLSLEKNDNKNLATALNNIGIAYSKSKDYSNALVYLKQAESIYDRNREIDLDLSILYSNIGIAYHNLDNLKRAEEYLRLAIKENTGTTSKYQFRHHLAQIYFENKDFYNAKTQNDLILERTKNKKEYERLRSKALKTAAEIEEQLFNYEDAFDFYQQHLTMEQRFSLNTNLEKQRLLELKTQLERSEKEIKLEIAAKEIEENKRKAEQEKMALENEKITLEKEKREKEIALLSQEQKAKEAQIQAQEADLKAQEAALKTKELESETQKQQLALTRQRLETEMSTRKLEEAQRQQELQQMQLETAQQNEQLKQQQLEAAQKAKEEAVKSKEAQTKLADFIRRGAIIGGIVSIFIIGLILWFLNMSRRKNKKLAQQNDEIEKQRQELEANRDLIAVEQQKSEELLLNILPGAIANELKEKGYATPKKYGLATVLFTDFGGFTKVSQQMAPDDLIEELNICFVAFDDIIERYGIQPIKTIGDSYMCVGGVPIEGSVSPSEMVNAALEINTFMNERLAQKKLEGIEYWDTRIGLHSGPVIAGVVGKKKFAYDIWGDAVNTASRMESGAEPNSVNISEATYLLIKNDFKCEYRGEFDVKNKGVMKMYKVTGK